jgi:hypothetical protein
MVKERAWVCQSKRRLWIDEPGIDFLSAVEADREGIGDPEVLDQNHEDSLQKPLAYYSML